MWSRMMCGLMLLAAVSSAETLQEAVDGYIRAADGASKPWKITGHLGVTVTSGNSDTLTATAGAEANDMQAVCCHSLGAAAKEWPRPPLLLQPSSPRLIGPGVCEWPTPTVGEGDEGCSRRRATGGRE